MSPYRSHTRILACVLAALCLITACAKGQKEVITEQKIKTILEDIDRAALSKDAEAIVKHFSKKARITVNIKSEGRRGGAGSVPVNMSMTFTPDQYRDYYKQAVGQAGDITYSRQDTKIMINPDGQLAAVGDRVTETATLGGKVIQSVTEETAVFEVEDGRVVITSLAGTVQF